MTGIFAGSRQFDHDNLPADYVWSKAGVSPPGGEWVLVTVLDKVNRETYTLTKINYRFYFNHLTITS